VDFITLSFATLIVVVRTWKVAEGWSGPAMDSTAKPCRLCRQPESAVFWKSVAANPARRLQLSL